MVGCTKATGITTSNTVTASSAKLHKTAKCARCTSATGRREGSTDSEVIGTRTAAIMKAHFEIINGMATAGFGTSAAADITRACG